MVVENSLDIVSILELDGTIRYESPSIQRTLGYHPEELIGQSIFGLVHPDDLSVAQENFAQGVTDRDWKITSMDLRVRAKGGSYRILEVVGRVIRSEFGSPVVVVNSRDVTARRVAEEKLSESKTLLATAEQVADMGSFQWYPGSDRVEWSDNTFRIYGLEVQRIKATFDAYLERVHPDDRKSVVRQVREATKNHEAFDAVRRIVRPDGSERLVEIRATPIFTEEGRLLKYVGVMRDVTVERAAEEARSRAEERYRDLVERSVLGITTYQDGRMVYANQAMGELLGYAKEELLEMSAEETRGIVHPDDRDLLLDRIERRFAGKKVTEKDQVRVITKQGEVKWLDVHVEPAEYEGGPALMTMSVDVTERKALEEAVRNSELRARGLLETSVQGVVTTDTEGCITFVNGTAAMMFGYTPEELIGKRVEVLVPERFRSGHLVHRGKYMKRPSQRAMGEGRDLFGLRKDGSEFPVEIGLSPVKLPGQTLVMATVTDITERKNAELRLKDQAERLKDIREIDRAILAAESPSAIAKGALRHLRSFVGVRRVSVVTFDEETETVTLLAHSSGRGLRVDRWSGSWDDGFRDQIKALKKSPVFTVEDISDLRASFDMYGKMYDAGLRSHTAVALKAGDDLLGALYLWSENTGVLPDETVSTCVEVANHLAIAIRQALLRERIQTQAAELEQRVEERTAKLAESNRELDAFAYSVSHDLRAPLRAMQGFGQALLEDYGGKLDPLADDFIERIVEAAGQMDSLIQDLLAYSRIVRSEIQPSPTSVERAVETALNQLSAEIEERRAVVNVNVGDVKVMAQHQALAQVLANLISNGIKFTPAGRRPRVLVRAAARRKKVRIAVRDNGIGIRDEHKERVFKMFERLHGIEEYPGTGIGLAIVKKGVERMGGRLWVESKEGKGSKFWLELDREG